MGWGSSVAVLSSCILHSYSQSIRLDMATYAIYHSVSYTYWRGSSFATWRSLSAQQERHEQQNERRERPCVSTEQRRPRTLEQRIDYGYNFATEFEARGSGTPWWCSMLCTRRWVSPFRTISPYGDSFSSLVEMHLKDNLDKLTFICSSTDHVMAFPLCLSDHFDCVSCMNMNILYLIKL